MEPKNLQNSEKVESELNGETQTVYGMHDGSVTHVNVDQDIVGKFKCCSSMELMPSDTASDGESDTESKKCYVSGSETNIHFRLEETKLHLSLELDTKSQKDVCLYCLQSVSDSCINERSNPESETAVEQNTALQIKRGQYFGSVHGEGSGSQLETFWRSNVAQDISQNCYSDRNSCSGTELNESPHTTGQVKKGLNTNSENSINLNLGPVVQKINMSKELDMHSGNYSESNFNSSGIVKLISKISNSDFGTVERLESQSEGCEISDIDDGANTIRQSKKWFYSKLEDIWHHAESDDSEKIPGGDKSSYSAEGMHCDLYKESENSKGSVSKVNEYSSSESYMEYYPSTGSEIDENSGTEMNKSPNRKKSTDTSSEMSTHSRTRKSSNKNEVIKNIFVVGKMSRRAPNIVRDQEKQADTVVCILEEVTDFGAYSWSELNRIIHRKLFSKKPTTHALLEILSRCVSNFKGQDDPEVVETLTEILAALRLYVIDENVAAYVVELPSFYDITKSLMNIIFTKEYSCELYTKYVLHMFHNLINTGSDEQKKYSRETIRNHDVCMNFHLLFGNAYGQFYECCALMYSLYCDIDIIDTDFASQILAHSTKEDLVNEYLDLLVEKLVYHDFIYLNYYKMPTIGQKAILNFVVRSHTAQSKSRKLI